MGERRGSDGIGRHDEETSTVLGVEYQPCNEMVAIKIIMMMLMASLLAGHRRRCLVGAPLPMFNAVILKG
jgi:hypothetical protein